MKLQIDKIIKESIDKVVNETITQYNSSTQGSTIGEELAWMLCEYSQNDKQHFVPLVNMMLRGAKDKQMLQSIGKGFVDGMLNWVKINKPKFWKNRIGESVNEGVDDREELAFYNNYGNQSQYPANDFLEPYGGELGMTAQYDDDEVKLAMMDDPEYFLDGKDPIYHSKKPGDYRTKCGI